MFASSRESKIFGQFLVSDSSTSEVTIPRKWQCLIWNHDAVCGKVRAALSFLALASSRCTAQDLALLG